jgi:hypothetical protein
MPPASPPASPASHHEGGCLCGAIRYRVEGAPTDTNVCYCTQCQRQTGAAMPAFAAYPIDRFKLLSGEPTSYRASDQATRQFCVRCGSSLFWRHDRRAELDVFLGTLDNPSAMPPPRDQIWAEHRAAWVLELARVPSYPAGRPRP